MMKKKLFNLSGDFKFENALDKATVFIDEQYQADVAKKIVELDNTSSFYLIKILSSFIQQIKSKDQAQGIEELLTTIFEDDNPEKLLIDNTHELNFLLRSILSTQNPQEAKAKQVILKKVLDNDFLIDDTLFMRDFKNWLGGVKSVESAQNKADFIDKIAKNDKLKNYEFTSRYLLLFLSMLETQKESKLCEFILDNMEFFKTIQPNPMIDIAEIASGKDFEGEADIKLEILKLIIDDEVFSKDEKIKNGTISRLKNINSEEMAQELLDILKDDTISKKQKEILINYYLDKDTIKKINNIYTFDEIDKKSDEAILIACKFYDIYKRESIEDLSQAQKRNYLKELISNNIAYFNKIDEIRKDFPLIPSNEEEYCKLLAQLVKSLDIEEKELNEDEIKEVDTIIEKLSKDLRNLSDSEFDNIKIELDENNKIKADNSKIEKQLNTLFNFFPELKKQSEIFKNSLKIIKEVSLNPEFEKLNNSDKKVILLAGLFCNQAYKENLSNEEAFENSAFDAFFITKRLKLSQDEQIKLYSLIKTCTRLDEINNPELSGQEKIKKEQDIAFDMRYDNLFDMAVIFKNANLDSDFKNEIKTIKNLIYKLQTSQPLLPVTKFPSADTIDKKIKFVKPDGSTNLKGIYKAEDGLVIIKFNELNDETLSEIGFDNGSCTRGIKTEDSEGGLINTGSIKFFVHGLDSPDQLMKFDAFSLPDSDALLSVSYAERPESKYRYFRPQGIILDCETKYIHGGGESDAGSGCCKNMQTFKDFYIFGAYREGDRLFISNLIKTELDLNDEEYIEFIKNNTDKSFAEIEPQQVREKLIKAFAKLNSNTRIGEREYNEMYISNPKPPMAVFAYETVQNKKIRNPVEFLEDESEEGINAYGKTTKERTQFLRQYALLRNIPFVVFGD